MFYKEHRLRRTKSVSGIFGRYDGAVFAALTDFNSFVANAYKNGNHKADCGECAQQYARALFASG